VSEGVASCKASEGEPPLAPFSLASLSPGRRTARPPLIVAVLRSEDRLHSSTLRSASSLAMPATGEMASALDQPRAFRRGFSRASRAEYGLKVVNHSRNEAEQRPHPKTEREAEAEALAIAAMPVILRSSLVTRSGTAVRDRRIGPELRVGEAQ
jgi:hypothetical protein